MPYTEIDWQIHRGALIMIAPKDIVVVPQALLPENRSSLSGLPATVCDVLVVADDGAVVARHHEAWIFHRVMQAQLKNALGHLVLGRLIQGHPKPGQSAPWQLGEATAQDIEQLTPACDEYIREHRPELQQKSRGVRRDERASGAASYDGPVAPRRGSRRKDTPVRSAVAPPGSQPVVDLRGTITVGQLKELARLAEAHRRDCSEG